MSQNQWLKLWDMRVFKMVGFGVHFCINLHRFVGCAIALVSFVCIQADKQTSAAAAAATAVYIHIYARQLEWIDLAAAGLHRLKCLFFSSIA